MKIDLKIKVTAAVQIRSPSRDTNGLVDSRQLQVPGVMQGC